MANAGGDASSLTPSTPSMEAFPTGSGDSDNGSLLLKEQSDSNNCVKLEQMQMNDSENAGTTEPPYAKKSDPKPHNNVKPAELFKEPCVQPEDVTVTLENNGKDQGDGQSNNVKASIEDDDIQDGEMADSASGGDANNKAGGVNCVSDALLKDLESNDAGPLDASTMSNDGDDSDEDEDLIREFMPRTKRRSQTSSSSSTTSGPDDEDSYDKSDSISKEEDDTKSEKLSKLSDTWHPISELYKRELGFYSNKVAMQNSFRTKVMGSVNMVRRLEQQFQLENHEGCVNALHFNRSGTLLASGSDDLNVVLWNWIEKKPYIVFDSGHRSNVFQSKFMPFSGDSHIVTCARDGQVRLAELSTTGVCKNTKKLAQHRGAAHKLALLSDSSHVLLSCGEDAVTFEIDLRQDKPNRLATTKENDKKIALYSIHSHPFDSNQFCLGGRDHYIRIYDRRMINEHENNGCVKKFCPHHLLDNEIKANVTCAVYNYDGNEVLGTYNDEDIYLFDNNHSDGAEYIHRYQGHRNNATVKGVNFYGPKSEFVVSGSDCGNVFLWEKNSEEIVNYFHADEGGVINVLEPHPHSPILATSGLDHDVKIFASTAQEPSKLSGLTITVKRNLKDREDERVNEPDMLDGRMLWFLMQHLRRGSRRAGREDGDDSSSSSRNSDDDSDDDPIPPDQVNQCVPS